MRRWRTFAPTVGAALLAVTSLAGLAGCPEPTDDVWFEPLELSGPIVAGDTLIFLDRSRNDVIRIDPVRPADPDALPTLDVDRLRLSGAAGVSALSADEQTLFIVDEERRVLLVVDVSEETLTAREVELSSAYDRLTVDPAGEFLLLSFTGTSNERVVARNLNEVGIVDLRSDELTAKFVTLSSRADQLIFAPEFSLDGSRERLVAALSVSEVTILDLLAEENSDDQLREVPLTSSEAQTPRSPRQAIFDVTPDDQGELFAVQLYVLTTNANDVTQITVGASTRSTVLKFDVSVNQLAVGQSPGRIELVELPDRGSRLLALDANQPRFTLVDVRSGEGATFALPMSVPGERVMQYTVDALVDGAVVPEVRLLVTSPRSELVSVLRPETISLGGDAPTLGRSVEAIRLEALSEQVQMGGDSGPPRAVVFHPGITGGLSVIDLSKNRDFPIQGNSLRSLDVGADGLAFGAFRGTPNLGIFDLTTGHPKVFELPQEGTALGIDEEDGLVLVQHASATGTFTVLDATEPVPERARVVRDVFINRLFDEEL